MGFEPTISARERPQTLEVRLETLKGSSFLEGSKEGEDDIFVIS